MARRDPDWSPDGPKRSALLRALRDIELNARQRFEGTLDIIEARWREKIAATGSIGEADQLGQDLAEQVVSSVVADWQRLRDEVRQRFLDRLRPFVEQVDALGAALRAERDAAAGQLVPPDLARDWTADLRPYSGDAEEMTTTLAREAISVLATVGVIAPPVAAVGGAAAVLWTIVRRFHLFRRAHLDAAEHQLNEHLIAIMTQIRAHYLFDADPAAPGRRGAVDEFLNALETEVLAALDAAAARKSQEIRAEMLALVEQSALDEHRRREQAARLQRWLAQWDDLGRALQALAGDVRRLDQALAAAPDAVNPR